MSDVRRFLALVKFHVAACMTTPRWFVVAPIYVIAFVSLILRKREVGWWNPVQLRDNANVWDVGLTFLCDDFNDSFIIWVGFMLLVGDDFIRGYSDGTLRSTLLFCSSPQRWWYAKIVSIGVRALAYMGLVFVSMVVASLVMGVPIEFRNSDASVGIAELTAGGRWYVLPQNWSTMGYALFCYFSLAFTIWILAVGQQVCSIFVFPNRRIPFIVFVVWLILSFVFHTDTVYWNVRFFLYPGKCFHEWGRDWVSIPVYFGGMMLVLAGAARIGYSKLRKLDF